MRKAAEILGVHPITLRRWEKTGKIRCIRTPSGQRRFPRSEILRLVGEDLPSGRRAVVYARVSSAKLTVFSAKLYGSRSKEFRKK
ncbi:MerR family DNA-binding transcriptional regulator [Ammonifex degensii]|uniref:MerR family DNA-binding transcriptional regulator n=1 Tax=Ammonifex degensii TaxID=42838 RepID=UPI0002D8D7E1